jgi:branched-chain amino acid transport system ATP-binding protein
MLAGELSYGQRKLIEFAAACVEPPRLLLLDEPAAAVNPTIINVIKEWILKLNEDGVTIVLVEHNIELVVDICERLVVLDHGVKIGDGDPDAVVREPLVQEAYFGG